MPKKFKQITLEDIAQHALVEYGFTPFFNQAVEHHLKRITTPSFKKHPEAADLRNLLWSSIDNIDSEDLDQCEYAERTQGGGIKIKIAVADVDHFVERADPVDKHASHNATSLYTGIKVFPMLPEVLSHDLSSLLPNEDRLAIVIEYTVKRDGDIIPGQVYQAWINNKAKLIYEEVGEWLDKSPQEKPPAWLHSRALAEQLFLQTEAARRLAHYRQSQGMLEFESVEVKTIIEDNQIKGLYVPKRTWAHRIIEQFMVAANQSMIHFLTRHQLPTIQRIVRVPERWGRIVDIAAGLNCKLPLEPDPVALRQFLVTRQKKSPLTFPDLSLSIIKLIGRGEYEMVTPGKLGHGHFGLAVGNYTHSTAPNRRYVDLIIQRMVKAALNKAPLPYTKRELVEFAAWCSERDAASKKVERFVRKVAAALLLHERLGENFEGIITGSSPKGVYVRLFNPPAEGRIMKGGLGLDVGQKVKVRLIGVDPLHGHIDFQHMHLLK